MSNIYINHSATAANTDVLKEEITFKSDPTITFVLTGIEEGANQALTLDINWGDGSDTSFNQKDLVFNYKKESIFNEMLYGKVGGTILDSYEHSYVPSTSSFATSLTAQFLVHYNNGFYANIFQPIKLVRESYYDNIQKLGIQSTQMTGVSGSNTVANLESKFDRRTYVTYLNN
jgi:hypothetical protein